MDEKAVKAKLLGYAEPNQYNLIEVVLGRIIISRDVIFNENVLMDNLTK